MFLDIHWGQAYLMRIPKEGTKSTFPSQAKATSSWPGTYTKRGLWNSFVK